MKNIFLTSLLLVGSSLSTNIDINGIGINKEALLFGACTQGKKDIVKKLIDSGVNVNCKNNQGRTPLFECTNNYEIFKMLIDAGANINLKDNSNRDIIDQLLKSNINQIPNFSEIITLIANSGGNFNNRDICNFVVNNRNMYNQEDRLFDAIKVLKELGVDISSSLNSIDLFYDLSAINLTKFLIDSGADINFQQNNGYTPLMWSVIYNSTDIIKLLLSKDNIDINVVDNQSKTAFDYACEKCNLEVIELFQNYFKEQEAKKLAAEQAVKTSVVNIENRSEDNLNILHSTNIPANSKAVITTEISDLK